MGYLLHIEGKRIYIAGDMDVTKEAKAVKCDVAMIPIGGFYTMDAKQAAELVNTIQPEVAIPVHYGRFVGKPADGRRSGWSLKYRFDGNGQEANDGYGVPGKVPAILGADA